MTIDPIRKLILGNTDALESDSKVQDAKTTANQSGYNRIQSYEDELIELDETSFGTFDSENADTDEIEAEIKSKEEEIKQLEQDTEQYIEDCTNEIEKIISEGTDVIPDEVQEQFSEISDEISKAIKGNTGSIQELSSTISENELAISRANDEIKEKEKEIKEKEDKIKSLEKKNDPESKEEIESLKGEIQGLNSEISKLNDIISNANKVIETANGEIEEYTKLNETEAERQKGLMNELLNEYNKSHTQEERVMQDPESKRNIEGLEECISNANMNLSENTLNLTNEINNLRVELAKKYLEELKAKEAAATAQTSGTSYSILGGNYTGDLPVNSSLASIAESTANSMGSTGWCLKGVNNALEAAYGFRLSYNSAYQAIPALQSRSDFTEVTNEFPTAQSLTNLPAGAIVVWENGNGHPHGHISIALGDGREASDHIQSQTVNYGTQYHVFIKNN